MIIDLVVGARPNFVKAAAILHAASAYPNVKVNLVHTGQHAGIMSDPFFRELGLPKPITRVYDAGDYPCLAYTERFASMIAYCFGVFNETKPDYVMVVGDTDSTLAGALAAKKMGLPLIHVEAGLRCGDRKMQEEINRVLVDSVSDICYTTTADARDNLIAEGSHARILNVGNVMVDTLFRFLPKAKNQQHPSKWRMPQSYAVLTLHRAESVDNDDVIFPMLDAIREVANEFPVIWPIHPRLKSRLGLWKDNGMFSFVPPMGYLDFILLLEGAKFVMTDSGGVQEETAAFGVQCLTLRDSTERPETMSCGTNHVIGRSPLAIKESVAWLLGQKFIPATRSIPLWDGHASDRIMADLAGGTPN